MVGYCPNGYGVTEDEDDPTEVEDLSPVNENGAEQIKKVKVSDPVSNKKILFIWWGRKEMSYR